MKTCSVNGCNRPRLALGYCSAHYQRLKNTGSLNVAIEIGDKSGHLNPNWRGGESKLPDGRVLLYCPDHPHPGVAGVYVLRYRLIMEKHLGRYLDPDEIVHHKNGDPTDDRIENLEVNFQPQHAEIHSHLRVRNERGQFCANA